jgi:hypothetical protein
VHLVRSLGGTEQRSRFYIVEQAQHSIHLPLQSTPHTPLAFFTFYLDVMKLGSIFPFGSSNKSESVAQPDKKLPPGFKAGRRGSSDDGIRRSRASVSPRSVDDMVMFTGRGRMVPSAEAQANQVAALSLLESKDYLCGQR